jgi:anthranilate synthase component 2
MKLLIFDNYDSFTYNLLHLVRELGCADVDVCRNDKIALNDVARYDKIILSPGPGIPSEAGLLLPLIKQYAPSKSILGVCLGHQAIGEAFGASLLNLTDVYHGIATPINIVADDTLFRGLPREFEVGRYHSWVIKNEALPAELTITATDSNNEIMAIRHNRYDVHGVQFHPESILTPKGKDIMQNFLTQ